MSNVFYAGQKDYIDKLNTLSLAADIAAIPANAAAAAASAAAALVSQNAAAASATTATTQATTATTQATTATAQAVIATTQASNSLTSANNAAASLASMNKDGSGGVPGLTLFKINFMNALGTFKSLLANANTAVRTYTFQDRDGTIADNTDLALKANLALVGAANGIAQLDATGRLPIAQLTAAVLGANVYQGTWNASTNTPTLVSSTGTKGQFYKVSVAGATSIDGITQWNAGDEILFNGTTWDKIDGVASEVLSVAGRTGVVTLAVADVSGAAPSASPTLTGTPLAPTPALGTNTTQIATAAAILAAGLVYPPSAGILIAVNTTLNVPDLGKWFEFTATGLTGTLPPIAGVLAGSTYTFRSPTYDATIKGNAAEIIAGESASANTYLLHKGTTLTLTANATGWTVTSAGSSYLPPATGSVLGGIKSSASILVDGAGVATTAMGPGTITMNAVIVATAGQTVFTVPSGYAGNLIQVFVNGYKLPPSDYSAVNGTSITLNVASNVNDEIETVVFSAQSMGATSTITRTTFVATDNQTTFNVTYAVGMMLVKTRGDILPGSDYVATNGTTVVFNTPMSAGTEGEFIVFSAMNLVNAVPSTGGTMTGPLVVPAGASGTQVPQAQEVVSKTGDSAIAGGLTVTGLLGYGTGGGGTVTQATNKGTAVTLNKVTGRITTAADALAAGVTTAFNVTNSFVTANDTVVLTKSSGTSDGAYSIWPVAFGGGFVLYIKNISAGSLSEALVFNFAIIKGAIA